MVGGFSLFVMSVALLESLRAGALAGGTRLDLCADLAELPEEILGLADSLEVLNVSGNRLTELPDWLPRLPKLRVLFCSENPFRHLPEVLGQCAALEMVGFKSCRLETASGAALPSALRWLILTDNQLRDVPAELGRRPRLQKLMLSGNRLTSLPEELSACRKLELLRLAANRFAAFPAWLWEHPALAWLALAGNPATALPAEASGPMAEVAWAELILGPRLGEGASGVIYRAQWPAAPPEGTCGEVAVKLFKGSMTSDGLPDCEMAVSLALGGRPHLPGILGKISGHPEGLAGLVMRLIDPGFAPLAQPPSLASCTRDVYAEDRRFSAEQAGGLLLDLARAAAGLRSIGLLHGDLYGHNVLYAADRGAILTDFGAASFYPAGAGGGLERLEVRAYGLLAQEVLERCSGAGLGRARLEDLAARCTGPEVAARPDFAEIAAEVFEIGRQDPGWVRG